MRLEMTATVTTIAANGLQLAVTYADVHNLSSPARTTVVLVSAIVSAAGIFTWHRHAFEVNRHARNIISIIALLVVTCVTVTFASLVSIQKYVVLDQRPSDGVLHVRASRSLSRITLTLVPSQGTLTIRRVFSNDDIAPRDSQPIQIGDRAVSVKSFRYPQEFVVVFTTSAPAIHVKRDAEPLDVQFISRDGTRAIWKRNTQYGGIICIVLASSLYWLSCHSKWMERRAEAVTRTPVLSEMP